MFFFYLITKKRKKIQAKQIKRADTQNLVNNDIGKIGNWHQKKMTNTTDKEKKEKRCLNSSQTLNYRHQFCNVHHTNDTGTPSDSEHEVKASRTSSSSSSRQFYPLLIHELDAHINPEGSLKKQFYHVFLFLNGMGRIFSLFCFLNLVFCTLKGS